jgi:hypothetical protein
MKERENERKRVFVALSHENLHFFSLSLSLSLSRSRLFPYAVRRRLSCEISFTRERGSHPQSGKKEESLFPLSYRPLPSKGKERTGGSCFDVLVIRNSRVRKKKRDEKKKKTKTKEDKVSLFLSLSLPLPLPPSLRLRNI